MPMDSVTQENADKLFHEYEIKCMELETIQHKTIMEMWNTELELLRQEYIIYKRDRSYGKEGGIHETTPIKKVKKIKKPLEK